MGNLPRPGLESVKKINTVKDSNRINEYNAILRRLCILENEITKSNVITIKLMIYEYDSILKLYFLGNQHSPGIS